MVFEYAANTTVRTPNQTPAPAALLIGYGLYMALMLDSYLTNFGVNDSAIGYVSNLPFMFGASLGIGLGTIATLVLRRRNPAAFSLPASEALAVLAAGYILGIALPSPAIVGASFWGFGWGCATTFLAATFMEMISACGSSTTVIVQLASGAFFSGALAMTVENAPLALATPLRLLLVAVCWICMQTCRKKLAEAQQKQVKTIGALKRAIERTSTPLVAYIFFDAAMGLINMYAFAGGSGAFSIAASGPMWGMFVCAGLLISYVCLADHLPNADFLNLALFPIAIGILLLLPFLGGEIGRQISVVLYAANTFTTTLSMHHLVMACRQTGADVCKLTVIVRVTARILLLAGLAVGWLLAQSSTERSGTLQTFMVTSICAYLLIIVLAYWGIHGAQQRRKETLASKTTAHDLMSSITQNYCLTPREVGVYQHLLQGGTAKSIGIKLGISPYTVQGHIRNLYAKLGVNKKDQAIKLFEQLRDGSNGNEQHDNAELP